MNNNSKKQDDERKPSDLPVTVLSLLLPYLDHSSLASLEESSSEMRDLLTAFGEWRRRFRKQFGRDILFQREEEQELTCKECRRLVLSHVNR